jgi:RDD family
MQHWPPRRAPVINQLWHPDRLCPPAFEAAFQFDWIDPMDTGVSRPGTAADLPRAGFWRRWLATLIDTIVIVFPFQVLAAVLFSMTAGMVQMDNGFYTFCAGVKTVPPFLNPPPPHDSNFARVCRVSFFGAPTGAILTVGRITREGATTMSVSHGYMLDNNGNPIDGLSIDWIVMLAFLTYLIVMIWKTGRSVGARILGTKVIDVADPGASGVPIRKAIIRYLAMAIGFVPAFALLIYQYAAHGGAADAMFPAGFFRWFMYAGGLALLWGVVLMFQIAAKKDPVYDRLAGTAVVKARAGEPQA